MPALAALSKPPALGLLLITADTVALILSPAQPSISDCRLEPPPDTRITKRLGVGD